MDNYNEAMQFLYRFIPTSRQIRYPGEAGLERMRKLLRALGNPQDKYPSVHVGGTSGKGSTSTMIAKILQESGYKTGLHISPHLQIATERMQVGGRFASEEEFIELINRLRPLTHKLKPTYFELLLAASFLHFAEKKVDIAVIEVGLGGKYDGTNVISPVLVVLTNVGLDHTHILGDTVEKIALDKREIIKPGVPVVTGATQESVKKLIREKAAAVGSQAIFVDTEKGAGVLSWYQAKNAQLARRAAKEIKRVGFKKINQKSIGRAFRSFFIPGRLEQVSKNPLIILDGAHNPEKMRATISSLDGNYCAVFAATKQKDVKGMLVELIPKTSKLFVTQYGVFTDMGRVESLTPQELADVIKEMKKGNYSLVSEPKQALEKAKEECERILVTGSLYLVGEIRNLFYPAEEILKRRSYT